MLFVLSLYEFGKKTSPEKNPLDKSSRYMNVPIIDTTRMNYTIMSNYCPCTDVYSLRCADIDTRLKNDY